LLDAFFEEDFFTAFFVVLVECFAFEAELFDEDFFEDEAL
jgi:hypothetical protein